MKRNIKTIIILLLFIKIVVISFIVQRNTGDNVQEVYAQQGEIENKKVNYTMLEAMELKRKELDKREELLKQNEDRLKIVEQGIDKKITKLEELRSKLEEFLTARKDLGEKSLKHLVKVYESMKPDQAAPLIEQIDTEIAIQILSRMKGKSVAKILGNVSPTIATKISEQLAKRK